MAKPREAIRLVSWTSGLTVKRKTRAARKVLWFGYWRGRRKGVHALCQALIAPEGRITTRI